MEVPQEVAKLRQWMLWSNEYGTKVPYQIDGRRAKSNDPSTWATLDECQEFRGARTGVAFVFSIDDPFCGVDLDDCIVDGKTLPWAQEILDRFSDVCYAEKSPSGTGIKLTTRAKKPAASRCNNQSGIECYDNRRFWTWTGQCLGKGFDNIGDGQSAVDWLVDKHLKAPERAVKSEPIPLSTGTAPFELVARGEAYIDACDAGRKGNLRNSAFKNAGHLHALIGEGGERLSDGDVLTLLKRWNVRSGGELREDELREAAVNGRKNGSPPADKEAKPRIEARDDSDVDLSGLLMEIIEDTPPDIPFSPGDFPRDAIPTDGIIGQIIAYNLATAMYPQPELALAGALALMSVITGRKIQSDYGTRTNIYVLGLGDSGAGKEHARKVNKQLLYASGAESFIGPERVGSSAGLTVALAERLACLYQLDEIGHLLATMKNPGKAAHLYNIGTVLMQVYSSSDTLWIGDAYADSKKTPKIDQPHAVLYGTCTPDGFWSNLTSDNVSNGLLGRMLVFEAPGHVDRRRPQSIEPQQSLVEAINWWAEFHPGGIDKSKSIAITAEHTPDAIQRFESHLDAICNSRKTDSKDAAALWSRSGEKAAKLALIFACSRQQFSTNIRVELDDVDRGIRIANWLTRRMLRQSFEFVADNFVEGNKKRLLRIINDGMTLNELSRKTQWLKSKERSEILVELADQELIKIEEMTTRGRTKRVVKRVMYGSEKR